MDDLKGEILEIFRAVREERDAPYDENNFIQYLIKPNGRSIHDTWKGKRYFVKFMNRVELQYGVTFPQGFYEKKWSLAKFAAYVDDRRRKPDVNRRYVLKQQGSPQLAPIFVFGFLNVIVFFPFPALLRLPFGWLYLAVPLAANIWLWRFGKAIRSHDERLLENIEAQRAALKGEDTSIRTPNPEV